MRKQIFCLVCGLAFLGTAAAASAGELSVKIANGRATVIAKDVPIRQILAEWAKVGETKVVGRENAGRPGHARARRRPGKGSPGHPAPHGRGIHRRATSGQLAGASQYDRVIILATSRPPAATASMAPPAFGRPAVQPIIQPPPDDDGEPAIRAHARARWVRTVHSADLPGPTVGPNGQVLGVPMNVPVGPNGVPVGPNGQPIVGPTACR